MITTNDHHALHRKNPKSKSDMQASQDMVNAFDKISVSVRRAYNVNRSQQDHLDNKVSTIENEHRKSMGLLVHEQKQFIRTRRKFSNIPLKSDQKHRKRRKLSNFSLPTEKDSIKTSSRLPSLVNRLKFEDEDSVETFKKHALNRETFMGSKRQNLLHMQDLNKRLHLPSIQEAQSNTAGQYTETNIATGSEREPFDKRIYRNTGNRRDTINKQQYVASWDISGSEERSKKIGKSYKNLDKIPLTPNFQLRMDESTSTKRNAYAYCDDNTIAENSDRNFNTAFERNVDTKNESPSSSNKKFHLVRSGTNTTSELESILDKTTEIRVKQFLKLPRIGGIHENPSTEHTESDAKDLQSQSIDTKRSSHKNAGDTLGMGKERAKSSLWKNLVHCRYLRLGEKHANQHRITNKNCECNWCAMMKKSVV